MSLSDLSLRDLEYVVALAELGSFVKAAERCHVSQPALSVQVGNLEARLRTVRGRSGPARLTLLQISHDPFRSERIIVRARRDHLATGSSSEDPP